MIFMGMISLKMEQKQVSKMQKKHNTPKKFLKLCEIQKSLETPKKFRNSKKSEKAKNSKKI